MLCIFFPPLLSIFIDMKSIAGSVSNGGLLWNVSFRVKRKHFVSMSLATREALSLLSTFLENSLMMQINDGVKQHEEKSVLLAF